MADDSPYWNKWEDELTESERAARAEDLSWARYREHLKREQRAQEEDERRKRLEALLPPRLSAPSEPEPVKSSNIGLKLLAVLVLLGGPSIGAIIYGESIADDTMQTIDSGQFLSGTGMMGILLTLVMIGVVFYFNPD